MKRLRGLGRDGDFLKLWGAQTISLFGSGVTFLALPLTAVLVLNAGAGEMGVLAAVESLPALLFSLFAGVWIDRRRRRPILMMADMGRALLLILVPVLAWNGRLQMSGLIVIGFLIGLLGLLFNTAYRAYLPSLIAKEQLVAANSKLEMSRSAAEIVGPGLAGWLVQLLSAPVALVADSVSFLFSGLLIGLIRHPEPLPEQPQQQPKVWVQIREGLSLVGRDPLLRAIAGATGTVTFFNSLLETVWILYVTRQLALEPGLIGLIFAVGSVGFMVGALFPNYLTRRLGLGKTLVLGLLMVAVGDALVPLAFGGQTAVTIFLIIASILFGLGFTVYNIGQISLRQAITPNRLQGRMNATMNFVSVGIIPVGALLGGVLGEVVGLRMTLAIAVLGELLAILWLLGSPVWALREQPEAVE